MANRFDGKVAIITGGASGIGKRTAELLVSEGARVVVADLDADGIGAVISDLGHNVTDGATLDVRDEDAVQGLVQRAVSRFGRLDIAVNAAGVINAAPLEHQSLDEWNRIVGVCLTGTFLSVKHQANQLIAQGQGGAIVNIASLAALHPYEGMAAYCAAKAGVSMLTSVAALEFAQHNIRVNCIGPGLIDTPMTDGLVNEEFSANAFLERTPLGRFGQPLDIANLAAFLASEEAGYITGQTIYNDGGASLDKHPGPLSLAKLAAQQAAQQQ